MFGRIVDWTILIVGLAGFAGTGWWAIYGGPQSAASLQARLEALSNAELASAGQGWARVEMDGQHAVLTGASPSHGSLEKALRILGNMGGMPILSGLTKISSEVESAAPISPYLWTAERAPDGKIRLSGHVPSPRALEEILAQAATISGDPARVISDMGVGSGEPLGDWLEVAHKSLELLALTDFGRAQLLDSELSLSGQATQSGASETIETQLVGLAEPYHGISRVLSVPDPLVEALASIDFSGDLGVACQTGFDLVAVADQVEFEDDERAVARQSAPILDQVVALAQRCPDSLIEVWGYTDADDGRDADSAVGRLRAETAREYIVRGGVAPSRIAAVGHNAENATDDDATGAGRAANRRVEFRIIREG